MQIRKLESAQVEFEGMPVRTQVIASNGTGYKDRVGGDGEVDRKVVR